MSISPDLRDKAKEQGILNLSGYLNDLLGRALSRGADGEYISRSAATALRLAAHAPDCPAFVRDTITRALGSLSQEERETASIVAEFGEHYGRPAVLGGTDTTPPAHLRGAVSLPRPQPGADQQPHPGERREPKTGT